MIDEPLNIMISNTCNLHCKHCYILKTQARKEKVVRNFTNIYNKIDSGEVQPKEICFYGYGDPLIDLVDTKRSDYLLYKFCIFVNLMTAHHPGIKLKTQSNLTKPLPKILRDTLVGFDTVRTSFDLKIRFESFKNLWRWYKNIKKLAKAGKPVKVEVTLTKYTIDKGYERWNKFFDKLIEKGYIESYLFHHLNKVGHAKKNRKIEYTKEEFVEFMKGILSHGDIKHNVCKRMFLSKDFFNRYYINTYKIHVIDEQGVVHTKPFNSEDTNVTSECDPQCYLCDYFKYCGGRSYLTDCFFVKDLYDLAKK